MISEALARRADRDPGGEFLSARGKPLRFGEAHARVREIADGLAFARGSCVGLRGGASPWAALHLLALDRCGARACIFPPDLDAATRDEVARELRLAGMLLPDVAPASLRGPRGEPTAPGEVVLFTSGTTGLPKAALHTWASLAGRVRLAPDLEGSRWLLTYALSAFAGLQVFLHALLNGGRITFGEGSPAAMAEQGARDGVTHVSGTPSFFRFLLASADPAVLARWSPRQITLGGEPVDQPVLGALARRFSGARITHIYASTEMGACFSVNDGRAGFPASFLDDPELPVRLRVEDGELLIHSPHRMQGYLGDAEPAAGDFFHTGDLVEVRGDRVHFLGRRSERINVGGRKVYPREIEEVILELASVQAVRVSGIASSLVGQLVAADVVVAPGVDPEPLRAAIVQHCRGRLAAFKVPRRIRFVAALEGTASGKLARK